jgi:hypothetical protein
VGAGSPPDRSGIEGRIHHMDHDLNGMEHKFVDGRANFSLLLWEDRLHP